LFILYSIVIGVAAGLLLGGRPAGLADLRIRWPWAMAVGLAAQLLLFSTPLSDRVGDLGPVFYVASTAFVVAAIVANRRITGMGVVALGAMSNLVAIVANGGFMPADPGAMASLGRTAIDGYSNSALLPDPALRPLTDIFALPSWVPFANVFSIGDVIIGLGVAIVIVAAMRGPAVDEKRSVVDPPESLVDPV
jgi:uncharacterized protein DUF5317